MSGRQKRSGPLCTCQQDSVSANCSGAEGQRRSYPSTKSSKCFWTRTPSLSSTLGIFCASVGRLFGIWSSSKPSWPSSSLGAPRLSEGGPRGRPPVEELGAFPRRCLEVLESPSDKGKPASLDIVGVAISVLDGIMRMAIATKQNKYGEVGSTSLTEGL